MEASHVGGSVPEELILSMFMEDLVSKVRVLDTSTLPFMSIHSPKLSHLVPI